MISTIKVDLFLRHVGVLRMKSLIARTIGEEDLSSKKF